MMTAPWDVSMVGSIPAGANTAYGYNTNTGRLHSSAVPFPGSGGGALENQLPCMQSLTSPPPPPLPPRQLGTRPIYSAYNRSSMMMPYSSYGSYGGGGFLNNGYGTPSYGYGSYGMGMGAYGGSSEPSFSQMAEESVSPAFQSIEAFVGAFCSISTMLESTFHAIYSSFRAVVGVVDHLGRVKDILSALTIFRLFKWVFRRFLYLIGISKIKPEEVESVWNNLSTAATDSNFATDLLKPERPSSMPILIFLGFIFAGPYLMWKLLKSMKLDSSCKEKKTWATGESEHFVAMAEFPFQPMSDRELELKLGQLIRLAPAKFQPPDVKGWVLASDGMKVGLVPTNYIKIKGKKSRDLTSIQKPLPVGIKIPTTINVSPSRRINQVETSNGLKEEYSSEADYVEAANRSFSSDKDAAGISSDDDTDTLVGEPFD